MFENQSAFIAGRQVLDAGLLAKKLVEDVKCWTQKSSVFKLDFEKASDRVSLLFRFLLLQLMGNLKSGSKVSEV